MLLGNDLRLGTIRTSTGLAELELSPEVRARHLYVPGSTGTGKSKFLEHLIRQDICNWGHTQCGLLLLDWHGSLYDPLVAYLAEGQFSTVPLILIDFSNPRETVRYTPLRKRESGDRGVIVGALAMSILHAWGQSTPLSTPRLYKWLWTILMTLYENGLPLTEAVQFIGNPARRARLAATVTHPAAKATWAMGLASKKGDLSEEMESTVNRLIGFSASQAMVRTFDANGPSLDFGKAIADGAIVLVSLSPEGNWIDEETAKTIGSLILSDRRANLGHPSSSPAAPAEIAGRRCRAWPVLPAPRHVAFCMPPPFCRFLLAAFAFAPFRPRDPRMGIGDSLGESREIVEAEVRRVVPDLRVVLPAPRKRDAVERTLLGRFVPPDGRFNAAIPNSVNGSVGFRCCGGLAICCTGRDRTVRNSLLGHDVASFEWMCGSRVSQSRETSSVAG